MANDFLQNSQFTLSFLKLPNVVLRLQTCSIPSLGMSHSEVGTPFSWIKEPDTKVTFSEFPITFKLDENFDGYLEVFNWMMGLSFPEDFSQYRDLKGDVPPQDRTNIFSDATLSVLTNANNPNIRVNFVGAFPTFLSQVDFETTNEDAMNIDIAASFEYQRFSIEKLS
jgi:hypothetical protein